MTTSVPDSAGVPADFTRHTLVAEYNSPDSVKALFEAYPDEIAAIIVEPVAANMGVVPPADGFLEFLREITKHYGALFIFDEVITGFGRCGSKTGADAFGVVPDIMTFAKQVTNGVQPLGGVIASKAIYDTFMAAGGPDYMLEFAHGYTYSAHPVACAAALAAIESMAADGLAPRAREIVDILTDRIARRVRGQ